MRCSASIAGPSARAVNARPAQVLHGPRVAAPDDAQPEQDDQQDIQGNQTTVPHRGRGVVVGQEPDLDGEQERDGQEDHGDPDHDVKQCPDQRPVMVPDQHVAEGERMEQPALCVAGALRRDLPLDRKVEPPELLGEQVKL